MKFSIPSEIIENTYLGNTEYEGDNVWGKYFYLEVNPIHLDACLRNLTTHPQYITYFNSSYNDNLFFVFEITQNQKKIVDPFLLGQYSKIDRIYVENTFKKEQSGNTSLNWRILNKDENWERPSHVMSLRDYWFARIGIELPENAEVWSKPEKRDEIYCYIDLD